MEALSVVVLCFVPILYIAASCHIMYSIFKKKKFNPMWVWVILIPLIGPMIYFSNKQESKHHEYKI